MSRQTSWHPPGNISILKAEYGAAFRAWCEQPVGKRFISLECEKINSIIPTLYGYDAVLIGEANFAACMQQSKIKNQYQVNDDMNFVPADPRGLACSRRDRLAIGTGLMDVVYLAHSLEFAANPHEVLREAYRILRADGHLLISMFNPYSLWGAWGQIAKHSSEVPWRANFMSGAKLKDWLALLGFDIMQINYFGFNLPLNKSNYSTKLSMFERYGQKLDLPFGAAYLVEAAKRVIPLTPAAPLWHAEPEISENDVIEPTA
ncbi:MAG TPA: methyltransferase domain-containing protein [Gammaproteobacteria bacterium]|nr:methyltransferase domain-containing protein [Gammaproteobacteria bacterium]